MPLLPLSPSRLHPPAGRRTGTRARAPTGSMGHRLPGQLQTHLVGNASRARSHARCGHCAPHSLSTQAVRMQPGAQASHRTRHHLTEQRHHACAVRARTGAHAPAPARLSRPRPRGSAGIPSRGAGGRTHARSAKAATACLPPTPPSPTPPLPPQRDQGPAGGPQAPAKTGGEGGADGHWSTRVRR